MIVITGGAGFIGSALVWALNKRGRTDIIIVDELDHDQKEENIGSLMYEELIDIKEFREKLVAGDYNNQNIEAILHMGACSDTAEKDWDYLKNNNVEYSKDIIRWCHDYDVRCVYASSAAVYGNGEEGYSDDHELFNNFTPLNLYGQSKLDVDIWARDGKFLEKVTGLRFFNVFGPNEWHKEHMQSVIAKQFPVVNAGKPMQLFKSYKKEYKDGEQKRDFIYIKDAVEATLFFLDNKEAIGVYNVGTGKARTWNDVAKAMFAAVNEEPKIEYIEMPEDMKKQYQYFTESNTSKMKKAGFKHQMMSLEDSIEEYVTDYLINEKHLA